MRDGGPSEAASSLRGAKRRSNPDGDILPLDYFAPLAMTAAQAGRPRHCEEQSDEAIQPEIYSHWIASLRSQ
ncbi:MAG: hypothetical protein LBT00_01845 [Spirochaetaceae bacterium]|nr:hypothetical protein [Spirochaetaceae bacterium]